MPREAVLPPIFAWLQAQVSYVQRVSDTEFSAACPNCGGTPHQSGEWPDRLRIFVDTKPLAWCRRCSWTRFADQSGDADPPDPADVEKWRAEQIEREEARKRSAEIALKNLRSERLWERYHEALDEHSRMLWRRRGIPDSLQDFWQLGYDHGHRFWRDGSSFYSPTLAIPIFGQGGLALNIKHRLIEPPPDYSKYRYEYSGITDGLLWRADPEIEIGGHVIVCEGEIKAMVTALRGGGGNVVGIPGTNAAPAVIEQLANAERITLVMDPDAKRQGIKLAKALGIHRCWLLVPPDKIDDGILAAEMTEREVQMLLRSAIRLSDYVTGGSR